MPRLKEGIKMRYQDEAVTIGEVVVELPKATEIFKHYGIDFCCGGHRHLRSVAKEQGIDQEKLFKDLDKAYEERKGSYGDQKDNFESMSPTVLSTYIEDTHHQYLRKALPQTAELLATILRVHGKNHPELFETYKLFGQLKTDLEQHLLKEETMLFPDFEDAHANEKAITELSKTIIGEHEAAGELLVRLRKATNHYTLPEDACRTFAKTYEMLEEIEEDLHQHIHLENNILLKGYASH